MHLLVNTLSIGSMSGEHVVYGFLRPVLAAMGAEHRATLLHCASQPPPDDIAALPGVGKLAVSDRLRSWAPRAAWEIARLPGLVKRLEADRVLNVSGAITPFLAIPQVSLAMNPWCYIPSARRGAAQAFKAWAQRRGHRYAFRHAEHMVYISDHLRALYRQANQDLAEREAPSTVAYVGLDDALHRRVAEFADLPRKPLSILSVSAFAAWKGVATMVDAVHLLRQRGIAATLDLAGPWPDPGHREAIEAQVGRLGLGGVVTIHGKVDVESLHRLYATHQVYCLMSSSESFGIPAAEAMAFGTPVVATECCAIAEVCERAGLFGPPGDAAWTARALQSLLTDGAAWRELSDTARGKAARLTWDSCSRSLFEAVGFEAPALRKELAGTSDMARVQVR
jgi:glycosyltransferase involved in cell wall biosynthesis